jgi:maltose O-acetyltransferase
MSTGSTGPLQTCKARLHASGITASLLVPRMLLGLPLPYRARARALNRFGCSVHPTARIETGTVLIGRHLLMGEDSYVNTGALLAARHESVTLGRRVHVGPGAQLLTASHRIGSPEQRAGRGTHDPVRVEDGVWIGAGAIVLPGVTIARGCVVAAGAVVSRDTRPDGLYAGVPATRIHDLS